MSTATSATVITRMESMPGARPRRLPGFGAVLRAELGRSRRTATWGVPLAVVVFSLHALLVAHAARTADGWNDGVLPWLNPYPAAFALPMGALTGAMAAWRERRHRAGGTAWRAVSPALTVASRAAVLAASALVSQVLLLAPIVVDALVRGAGWGPWPQYLLFALVMWVSVTGASTWGLALGQWLGGVAVGLAPALALVWSAAGALHAEAPSWWARPWTWAIRPTLPLLEVHGNGVSLEAGSPVWDYPVAPGLLGSAGLCLLGVGAALLGGHRAAKALTGARRATLRAHLRAWTRADGSGLAESAEATPAPVPAPSAPNSVQSAPDAQALRPDHAVLAGRPNTSERDANASQGLPQVVLDALATPGSRSVFRAVALGLPWRLWLILTAVLLGLLALTQAAYSAAYALPLFTLAGAPIAAWVAGATAWRAQADAWRGLVLRARPATLTAATLAWVMLLLAAALIPTWAIAHLGAPLFPTDSELGGLGAPVYMFMVTPFVAFMLAALAHALAQVAGTAVTIVVGVGLFLMGLIIDGNEVLVATPLWRLAPWGWIQAAGTYPERWGYAALLSLTIGLAAFAVSAARGRAVAARQHE
ncbi:MAG: hypothetical protein E7Z94_00280 [Actinomyces ruminicola]|uniref:ABC-2 type transport system permease protein n=1 Tax=Actinomyces ruminicola TaxID=332524 RepID=A0A1G9XEY9_9ACTO|nr:hypothetical protein [Actinomyces ruminicola]MBE6480820.1 hypothetical protein [Actinomyces ruminicola]SDM95379.1 hypothetical protein SAMN04487766_109114 [Actinomyces ruminicola]